MDGILSYRLNEDETEEILRELPAEIGMEILAGPLLAEGSPKNPGWTGVVIIDKSHIAIHTFEESGNISIDIFSCKSFERDQVINYLENKIRFKKYNARMITRSEE